MKIIKNRKWFYGFSGTIIILCIVSISIFGLNLGIDFAGGTAIEIDFKPERPAIDIVKSAVQELDQNASVRPIGDNGFLIKIRNINEQERENIYTDIKSQLKEGVDVEENRYDSVGPVLGREAINKSILSIVLVVLSIIIFISYAFRNVSEPVSSWKYGLVSIIALIHDVLVPIGLYSFLGYLLGYEIDTLFITALLVILGFSIHDTIVVFDRIRESQRNTKESNKKVGFEEIVEDSIKSTMARSINTSFTTLLAVIALYFLGGEATKSFALVLAIGILAGTYSSIFLASPLLVDLKKRA